MTTDEIKEKMATLENDLTSKAELTHPEARLGVEQVLAVWQLSLEIAQLRDIIGSIAYLTLGPSPVKSKPNKRLTVPKVRG